MTSSSKPMRGARFGLAGLFFAILAPFASGQLYFDVNSGTGLGTATNGGTYDWNTSLWNTAASGNNARVGWTTNTARFNAGANTYTVNVSAATLVSGIVVTNGSVTIGSSTGSLGLSASSSVDVASTKSLTIATALSGSGFSLTSIGAGTLNLTAANTYSGGTTVSAGTLNLSGSGTLGSTSAAVLVNGGTLALGSTNQTAGSFTISSGTLSGSGILTAATYALQGGTVSGKLGTGTATVTTGTTTLSGTLSAGTVNVNSGTLSLSSANRIIDTAAVTVGGGTLAVGGNDTVGSVTLTSGTISGAGTLTAATYALQGGTVSGKLGTGTATVTSGTTTLSGTLSAGTVNVNSGTLSLSSANRIIDTAAVTVGGGTLAVGGNDTVGSVTLTSGTISGAGTLTAATYALQGGTVSGSLGAGTVNVSTGSTTLSGTSSAGTVNLNSGTLTLGAAERLSNSAALNVAGGALDLGANSETVGAVSLTSGSITGSGGTLTGSSYNVNNAGAVSVTAKLGGSGALTKAGTGTLTLSGDNSYAGATSINAGTVIVTANNALGTAAAGTTVAAGATLGIQNNLNYSTAEALSILGSGASGRAGAIDNISGANTFAGSILFNGDTTIGATAGSLTLSNTLDLASAVAVDSTATFSTANSTSFTISGKVTDASNTSKSIGLTLLGNGSLTLSNSTNDYWGNTTIGASGSTTTGSLIIGAASGALPTVNNASILRIYSGTLNLNNNNATSFGSLVLGGGGATSTANVTTGTGTLTLGGDVTYDATNNAAGSTITGKLDLGSSTRTFAIGDSSATASDLALSAIVSGSGNLVKTATGTLTLSGANSYTGTTTISQGTIAVGANAPSGAAGALGNTTSAVVINDGSTGASATGLTIATTSVTVGRAVTVANNGSGTVILGGDTSLTSGTGTFSGNVALGRATTFQASGASNITFSGVISGAGAVTKTDTGTVTFTNTGNSGVGTGFTGTVSVANGTLKGTGTTSVGGFAALGDHSWVTGPSPTTVITVANGATLEVSSSYTGGIGSSNTQQYQTMSLTGGGYNNAGALNATGGNNTWLGNITLGGNTTIQNSAIAGDPNALVLGAMIPYPGISPPTDIKLNGNTLTFKGTGDVFVSSRVGDSAGDTGAVIVDMTNTASTVYFAGTQNHYTGATQVKNGTLALFVDPGNHPNTAILGNLTIGDGSGAANTAVVTEFYNDQIDNGVAVTINSDGLLDLGTYGTVDTIGAITLNGGRIATTGLNNGTLNMAGDIHVTATSTISGDHVSGGLYLNNNIGDSRTFNVDSGTTLNFNAVLGGNGGFTKSGTGTMIMTRDSTFGYYGVTNVSQGILNIQDSGALAQSSNSNPAKGTVVASGATLQLENNGSNITVGPEALTLNGDGYTSLGALNSKVGTNSWAGLVTVATNSTVKVDAGTLTLSGQVTGNTSGTQTLTVGGAGNTNITSNIFDTRVDVSTDSHAAVLNLTKEGSGTLTLSNVNTFTGDVNVNAGTLVASANQTFGSTVNDVNVANGATLSFNTASTSNTIATLTGGSVSTAGGVVSIAASATLIVNNSAADSFSGRLSGSGLFQKQGAGTFTFESPANTSAFNFAGEVKLAGGVSAGMLEFKGGLGTLNTSSNALSIGTLSLTGGTLLLTNAYINVGTLNITGNTILDFGTGSRSILNATNIYIASGVVVTVKNWSSEVDFLFANSDFRVDNATGQVSIRNQIGTGAAYTPEDQVWFQGDPQSPDGSHTTWIDNTTNYYSYANREIRPVPEPSTYGALFLAGCLGLVAFKRFRKTTKDS